MKYIDRTNTYVAVAKAIIKPDYYKNPSDDKLSNPIDYILVHPVKKLRVMENFRYNISNTSFTEINTDKEVIKRHFNCFGLDSIDFDIELNHDTPIVGDVCWKIDENTPVEKVISIRELNDYMHLSKEEIYSKLCSIRLIANQIGLENYIYDNYMDQETIYKKRNKSKILR